MRREDKVSFKKFKSFKLLNVPRNNILMVFCSSVKAF